MSWASQYIGKLKDGETVQFRPFGKSMEPLVKSGQRVFVAPIDPDDPIKKGDIVLCTVNGKHFLHLVRARRGNLYQIGNNKGHINGWISLDEIHGILIMLGFD